MTPTTTAKTAPPQTEKTPEPATAEHMRLNRFLARAGIASRRKSDELIRSGAVRVNGQTVSQPGLSVAVDRDRVECGDQLVVLPTDFEYLLFHKPAGCLVTRSDTHGRPTVFDHIEPLHAGTVAVGRLDQDTTGLLLLTDDGELAFRLMHPRYEVEKRYQVWVTGRPRAADLQRLRRGVQLEDGPTVPARVRILRQGERGETLLEMRLHEGRKRQIKRMCQAIGHRVRRLKRTVFAGLDLRDLQPGQWRPLEPAEVQTLRRGVGLNAS